MQSVAAWLGCGSFLYSWCTWWWPIWARRHSVWIIGRDKCFWSVNFSTSTKLHRDDEKCMHYFRIHIAVGCCNIIIYLCGWNTGDFHLHCRISAVPSLCYEVHRCLRWYLACCCDRSYRECLVICMSSLPDLPSHFDSAVSCPAPSSTVVSLCVSCFMFFKYMWLSGM
jgi:hypothetical protein